MFNILIRPLERNDAKTSFHWRNDPEVWKYTGNKPDRYITEDIEAEWIEKVTNEKNSKRFAIICELQYIGNIQLTNISASNAEFHIFIGNKEFWGKGVSQLATYQILYYAKEVLKISEIYLSVKPDNLAAINSYKRNNFTVVEENSDVVKMSILLSKLKTPKLSIFVMVYNHAEFLKSCLEGLLMQKTNFNYDIVIGEDCSTDDSRQILLEYQKKFPGKFKLILQNKNIGAVKNQRVTFENCKGKYIAMCEGDDYWTDPLKIQRQVDFLEEHDDYNICFHKTDVLKGTIISMSNFTHNEPKEKTFEIKDLISKNFISTPSVVFRNHKVKIPDWMDEMNIGDYPLYLLLSVNSKIKYLPQTMAIYRSGVGVWSTKSIEYKKLNVLKSLSVLSKNFPDPNIKQLLEDDLYYKSLNFMKHIYPNYYELHKRHNTIKIAIKNLIGNIIFKKK